MLKLGGGGGGESLLKRVKPPPQSSPLLLHFSNVLSLLPANWTVPTHTLLSVGETFTFFLYTHEVPTVPLGHWHQPKIIGEIREDHYHQLSGIFVKHAFPWSQFVWMFSLWSLDFKIDSSKESTFYWLDMNKNLYYPWIGKHKLSQAE